MTLFTDCIIGVLVYAMLQFLFYIFTIPYNSMLAVITDIFYWAILFLHLKREQSLSECGIQIPCYFQVGSGVVLLLIPAFQCFLYGFPRISLRELLALLLAALAEEMAFRVMLPKLLSQQMRISIINAVLLSSGVFALFHGATRLVGVSWHIVLLLMLYAFCAGFAFCAMVQKMKSVFPSVILHTVINWTAGSQTDSTTFAVSTLAFSTLFAGYAILIYNNTQKGSIYL